MKIISLNNKYVLEVVENDKLLTNKSRMTDINSLKFENVKINKILLIKIDFNTISVKNYKRILKQLLHIKQLSIKKKIQIGQKLGDSQLIGYIFNYDKDNKAHNNFIDAINAITYNSYYERYNYIYDTVCNYLDNFFYDKNLCDFQDNKCIGLRNGYSEIGCCRRPKIKWLLPFSKLIPCEYLNKDLKCSAQCISCKLFTCTPLKKQGVDFKIKDILLLDIFFNPIQKYYIKTMVFTPKQKILKRLMLFK